MMKVSGVHNKWEGVKGYIIRKLEKLKIPVWVNGTSDVKLDLNRSRSI